MDFNFDNLKKEAAADAQGMFAGLDSEAIKKTANELTDEILCKITSSSDGGAGGVSTPGKQDDNSHTEDYFSNDQKKLEFDDPQDFVQRMSAGVKEVQEELDAKFAQETNVLDDFYTKATNELGSFGKQGVADITKDFMDMERGNNMMYASNPLKPSPPQATVVQQVVAEDNLLDMDIDSHFSQGPSKGPQAPSAPPATSSNFYDVDDFDKQFRASKDSDTDSTSVSANPSPAKKAIATHITDALKEQDNDKFISSEDLLSDAYDNVSAQVRSASKAASSIPVTDLDEDFVMPPKPQEELKPAVIEPPVRPQQPPPPAPVKDAVVKPVVAPARTSSLAQPKAQDIDQPKIVSVEEIFYKYGLDAWFKPERLHPQVESLIYWRDVKKSGIVFGAGLIILLAISCFSVISVLAYVSLLTLTGTIAFRIYKSVMQAVQKTSDGHPFKDLLDTDLTLSQEKVQNIAGVAVAHVNGCVAELRRLFLVEDLIDSIKFGGLLWVLTYVGAWFNGMTLVILTFVALFTLPKVYENNKQSIDTYLDLVRSKLAEVTEKIKAALPIGAKKAAEITETDKDK